MRGLHARLLLAQYRIARTIDLSEQLGDDLAVDASESAFEQGYEDAAAGYTEPPAVFGDEAFLLAPWMAGQRQYLLTQEIHQCPMCNDFSIDHCAIHG